MSVQLEEVIDEASSEERYFLASQWQLIWRKFKRHKLAVVSVLVLAFFYFIAITYEFWAPYDKQTQHQDFLNAPPTRIHLFDSEGKFRGPFVYDLSGAIDFETFTRVYKEDESQIHPIRFFQRGDSYRFWGIFRTDLHFIGSRGTGTVPPIAASRTRALRPTLGIDWSRA